MVIRLINTQQTNQRASSRIPGNPDERPWSLRFSSGAIYIKESRVQTEAWFFDS